MLVVILVMGLAHCSALILSSRTKSWTDTVTLSRGSFLICPFVFGYYVIHSFVLAAHSLPVSVWPVCVGIVKLLAAFICIWTTTWESGNTPGLYIFQVSYSRQIKTDAWKYSQMQCNTGVSVVSLLQVLAVWICGHSLFSFINQVRPSPVA